MGGFISDLLRDAGASSMFWIGLAILLIIAVVGYLVARRAGTAPSSVEHGGKVTHDWMPTGRLISQDLRWIQAPRTPRPHFSCKPRMFVSLLVSVELSAKSLDGEGRRQMKPRRW
jgi:hypothetical protein